MDPNECLKEIRQAMETGDLETVASALYYLDEWLSNGGFLPDAWATARERGIQIGHGNTQINTF